MFSLVFLVCFNASECMTASETTVFKSIEECQQTAIRVADNNKKRVKTGAIRDFNYLYECVAWGNPA